jgi:hypothetical protein
MPHEKMKNKNRCGFHGFSLIPEDKDIPASVESVESAAFPYLMGASAIIDVRMDGKRKMRLVFTPVSAAS